MYRSFLSIEILSVVLLACSVCIIKSYTSLNRPHKLKFFVRQIFSSTSDKNAERGPLHIARKNFDGRGCILVSNNDEFDRFMSKSIVFIFEHSTDRGTQGVILNKVTFLV